jgi:imidazolonepropionase-like amidohydrolase
MAVACRWHRLAAVQPDIFTFTPKSNLPEMMNCRVIALLVLLSGSLYACATAPVASISKVITGATLIDGTGRAPISDAVIVIEGTRITRVASGNPAKIPPGAQVIDAGGKFIIPGLADMHNHLGDGTFGPPRNVEDWPKNLARLLPFGFTMIFTPEMHEMKGFAQLKQLAAADDSRFPHFFGVGNWFQAKGSLDWQKGYAPETPEQARSAVRQLRAANVDAVKFVYSDNTYAFKKPNPKFMPEVMAAIIDEAHRQGLKAYAHAPILKFAKEVLRAGGDGLVHGILSDPVDEEFIELMKKNRAIYIPTHAVFEAAADIGSWARREAAFNDRGLIPKEMLEAGMKPEFIRGFEQRIDNLAYMKTHLPILHANTKKVFDAGILVIAGSDNNHTGTGIVLGLASQLELVLMTEAGLTPMQVLQTATINAARMVGREKDLGSVEVGKLADLVILDADPLADIGNVRRIFRVIKGGVVHNPNEMLHAAR